MMVEKIISGGQTGGDQGGLQAGQDLGLKTGGTAPKGWHTEEGPAPWLGTIFGLEECQEMGYPPRTKANAKNSDGTIWFGETNSPGYKCTANACNQYKKPLLVVVKDVTVPKAVIGWLHTNNIKILNVAGNRESKSLGLQERVRSFLVRCLHHAVDEKTRKFESD